MPDAKPDQTAETVTVTDPVSEDDLLLAGRLQGIPDRDQRQRMVLQTWSEAARRALEARQDFAWALFILALLQSVFAIGVAVLIGNGVFHLETPVAVSMLFVVHGLPAAMVLAGALCFISARGPDIRAILPARDGGDERSG